MNKKLLVTGILLSTLAFGATNTTTTPAKKETVVTKTADAKVVKKEVKKVAKKSHKKAAKKAVAVKKVEKKATK